MIVVPPVPWSCDGKGSTAAVLTQPQTLLVDDLCLHIHIFSQTNKSISCFVTDSYALETTCLGNAGKGFELWGTLALPFLTLPSSWQSVVVVVRCWPCTAQREFPILTAPTCKKYLFSTLLPASAAFIYWLSGEFVWLRSNGRQTKTQWTIPPVDVGTIKRKKGFFCFFVFLNAGTFSCLLLHSMRATFTTYPR